MSKNNISNRRLPELPSRTRSDALVSIASAIGRLASTAELIGTREEIYLTIENLPYDGLKLNADRTLSVEADEATITVTATVGDVGGVVQIKDDGIENVHIRSNAAIDAAKIHDATVSNTEFGYLDGVTSAIQTQLNAKQPLDPTLTALAAFSTNGVFVQTAADSFVGRTITGTAAEVTVSNGDGVGGNPTLSLPTGISAAKIGGGAVSSAEFDFLNGVTSAIQTQLDAKVSNLDLSWEPSMWGMRVVKDPGTGTFVASDASLQDTTDADAIIALNNFLDARIDRQLIQFVIPTELDTTQTVSIVVFYRLSATDPSDTASARLNFELRNIPVNSLIATAGEAISVTTDFLVGDLIAGTLQTATFTAALTTAFLAGGTFVHGSFSRLGTHANDSYTGTIQLLNIQFKGKRKKT